ncbi:MAG: DUF3568 family protein [Candidatus Omnitrophica bacterium]|nr:DUF3568 family protein [Candidatus Omnitrophota bacterium]
MFKKVTVFVFSGLLLLNIYGCFAIVAGAAAGTGTAVWLSGKLTQQFNAPYEQTINAARSAVDSLKLTVVKETKGEAVAQIKGNYTDGREFWIDIRKVTEASTKVEVRVGGVSADKAASDKILKRIESYL